MVAIDAEARIADAIESGVNITSAVVLPLMLLFDFTAAFPSIDHQYLFAIL